MNYHPDIKKILLFIAFFIFIVATTSAVTLLWSGSETQSKTNNVLGKYDIKTMVTCDQGESQIGVSPQMEEASRHSYRCHLSKDPMTQFDFQMVCRNAMEGKVCIIQVTPRDEDEREVRYKRRDLVQKEIAVPVDELPKPFQAE